MAATNRDLAAEVAAGRFRRDLYYRLLVCPIEIPPLRARGGDVLRLFQHFWAARGETRPLESAVAEALQSYEWPGNVRELENLVERLSVCAEGATIRVSDLPLTLRARRSNGATLQVVTPAEPTPTAPAPSAVEPCPDADAMTPAAGPQPG